MPHQHEGVLLPGARTGRSGKRCLRDHPVAVSQPPLDYCPDGGPGIVRGVERQGRHGSLPVADAAICPQQSPAEKGGCPGEQVEAGLVFLRVDPLQVQAAETGLERLHVYGRLGQCFCRHSPLSPGQSPAPVGQVQQACCLALSCLCLHPPDTVGYDKAQEPGKENRHYRLEGGNCVDCQANCLGILRPIYGSRSHSDHAGQSGRQPAQP